MEKSETISWRVEVTQFLILVLQLGLLFIAFRQFQIESGAFLRIAALAFAGFAVNYFLPLRYRLSFFLGLSLLGIAVVMGLASAAWLIAVGMVLIGLCHCPINVWGRVALLLAAGVILATLRVEWLTAPWSPAIWPILGSMFMFRLMVYLYDLEHDKASFSLARTMSYFFMLPNVCFPMFPVVDYKTFRRNYYDTDRHQIYQTGIRWMTRGVVHLILYRFVYYYLSIAPSEVNSPREFVQLLVTTFLLYLRISGQFHLIVGMLHMFGFRLPETHHLYYLASSFTDIWRRINIYWKDFMMKVFYYPMYFRLRRKGDTAALVWSTLFVFFVTWALHSYQWFWLRGAFLLSGPDVMFWVLFTLLVVLNSLYELKYGRQRSLTGATWSVARVAKQALQTLGTFIGICMLWLMWTSETFLEFAALWEAMGRVGVVEAILVATVVCGGAIGVGMAAAMWKGFAAKDRRQISFSGRALINVGALGLLAGIGIPVVYAQFGPDTATLINSLRSGRLSRVDVAMLERGYYENLTRVDRFNSQLWEVYMNRPASWLDVVGTGLEEFRNDFLQKELVPSFVSFTNHGSVRTNRWGMRDQEYEKLPPEGTYRIALLGASTVMGWGVSDGETFEALLERRLNHEKPNKAVAAYEILNFGAPGYQPLQQLMVMEKSLTFHPNTVIYVAHPREATRAVWYLSEVVSKGIPVPYDYLNEILQRAGVPSNTPEAIATRRLLPYGDEILAKTFHSIVAESRTKNVLPILVFMPTLGETGFEHETPVIMKIAGEAGFMVLDLNDVFKGHEVTGLWLAEWDMHPNAKGHQLVADRMYDLLAHNAEKIFTMSPTVASASEIR
jgi:hypothetical protein